MTRSPRLLALLALIAGVVAVSSYSLGQSGSKRQAADSVASPQLALTAPGSAAAKADAPVPDRFSADRGVLTYRPVKGDMLFAAQLKPVFPATKRLPRDYVIVLSTSAAMAGPGWIGALQIADGVIQNADAARPRRFLAHRRQGRREEEDALAHQRLPLPQGRSAGQGDPQVHESAAEGIPQRCG